MREIKFRGKRYKHGDSGDDWVYGDFYHSTDGRACIDQWVVKPKTVSQYTDIKDSNGVDIFEGDVIQFADKWEWYRTNFAGGFLATDKDVDEVKNDHVKYPYERRVVEIPKDYEWLLRGEIQSYWEVIGNIHENPELLGSKS